MLAGPSGIAGSGTTSCGLYCPSARSRRLTMVPETLIVCPVMPEVKVTVYAAPTTNAGLKSVTGVPVYATPGRTCAGGGGGLSQPQPPRAGWGAAAESESTAPSKASVRAEVVERCMVLPPVRWADTKLVGLDQQAPRRAWSFVQTHQFLARGRSGRARHMGRAPCAARDALGAHPGQDP